MISIFLEYFRAYYKTTDHRQAFNHQQPTSVIISLVEPNSWWSIGLVDNLLVNHWVGGGPVSESVCWWRICRWIGGRRSIGGGQPVAVSVVGWRWPVGNWWFCNKQIFSQHEHVLATFLEKRTFYHLYSRICFCCHYGIF